MQSTQRISKQLKIPKGYKLVPEVGVSNEEDIDSDTEGVVENLTIKSKPKIQILKGLGDKVSIENWLKRFKMLANFCKWDESNFGINRKNNF